MRVSPSAIRYTKMCCNQITVRTRVRLSLSLPPSATHWQQILHVTGRRRIDDRRPGIFADTLKWEFILAWRWTTRAASQTQGSVLLNLFGGQRIQLRTQLVAA